MGMIKLDLSDFYYKYEKYLDSVFTHMFLESHVLFESLGQIKTHPKPLSGLYHMCVVDAIYCFPPTVMPKCRHLHW